MITFTDATDLEAVMKLAAEHHHAYQTEYGADENWATWYANFIWVKLTVEETQAYRSQPAATQEKMDVDGYAAWAATPPGPLRG